MHTKLKIVVGGRDSLDNMPEIKIRDRVIIVGTPLRGVVVDRKDDVVLVYRDDSDFPMLLRVSEVEVLG